jgi:hypothetical protein
MGRYITTTGTSSTVLRSVTTTYSAVVNDRILANSTSAAFTITLPLSTSLLENDTIQIIDIGGVAATNNITIARNGAKIQNLSEDLVVNVNNASLTLVYTGATFGWVIAGT